MNLICVEDGIDSSKEAGKLLISIIAAVAEMERENYLNNHIQKIITSVKKFMIRNMHIFCLEY